MPTVGRAGPEPTTGKGTDAVAAHQPRDATTAATASFRPQGGMHPRRTVTPLWQDERRQRYGDLSEPVCTCKIATTPDREAASIGRLDPCISTSPFDLQ